MLDRLQLMQTYYRIHPTRGPQFDRSLQNSPTNTRGTNTHRSIDCTTTLFYHTHTEKKNMKVKSWKIIIILFSCVKL